MARTRWLFGLLAIGCALLMLLAAAANTFVNSSDGTFTSMQTPSDSGTAFWNHLSFDNAGCNVGFVLEGGTLSCGGDQAGNGLGLVNKDLSYLGNTTTPLTPAHFSFASPGLGTSFIFTATAYHGTDALYRYDTSLASPGPVASQLIFVANQVVDPVGTTKTITGLPASWGLLLVTGESGTRQYLSNGTGNGTGRGFGQFALFYDSANLQYYAGMEDLNISGGDKDYNDMVIEFAPVPEPATMFLGGLGLIAFGYAARRRLFSR